MVEAQVRLFNAWLQCNWKEETTELQKKYLECDYMTHSRDLDHLHIALENKRQAGSVLLSIAKRQFPKLTKMAAYGVNEVSTVSGGFGNYKVSLESTVQEISENHLGCRPKLYWVVNNLEGEVEENLYDFHMVAHDRDELKELSMRKILKNNPGCNVNNSSIMILVIPVLTVEGVNDNRYRVVLTRLPAVTETFK